jgi:hypothetical protein
MIGHRPTMIVDVNCIVDAALSRLQAEWNPVGRSCGPLGLKHLRPFADPVLRTGLSSAGLQPRCDEAVECSPAPKIDLIAQRSRLCPGEKQYHELRIVQAVLRAGI